MSDARNGGRLVLLIDSDEPHGVRLAMLLRSAGYDVESTAHDVSLPHLGAGGPFGAVILCASEEPSTLSAQDPMGAFVLRYMMHVVPNLLPHTIVLTANRADAAVFADEGCATLGEPVSDDLLLQTLAARISR